MALMARMKYFKFLQKDATNYMNKR